MVQMNNGVKIMIDNIQYSSDGENYKSLGAGIASLNCESNNEIETEYDNFLKDINKPVEFKLELHKKRHGSVLERHLYYCHNKKKRIRKKYDLWKLFARGMK